MSETDEKNDLHLKQPCFCQRCSWRGKTGGLIASGYSPDLHCPQCGEAEIGYEPAERLQ